MHDCLCIIEHNLFLLKPLCCKSTKFCIAKLVAEINVAGNRILIELIMFYI